ncbi:MAG TPA: hypothetical protein DEH78_11155 [Solibacterales bacterium]|nr:hypothetical protein [Bryobacterales bacterium]
MREEQVLFVHRPQYYNGLSPTTMDTRNFTYMFYGFLAAWLILIGYLVSLAMRGKKVERQIEDLRRLVDERERK